MNVIINMWKCVNGVNGINGVLCIQKIDKIIDHPSTSVSNKNMDPKKKWRQTYFNNGNKLINS